MECCPEARRGLLGRRRVVSEENVQIKPLRQMSEQGRVVLDWVRGEDGDAQGGAAQARCALASDSIHQSRARGLAAVIGTRSTDTVIGEVEHVSITSPPLPKLERNVRRLRGRCKVCRRRNRRARGWQEHRQGGRDHPQ